MSKVLRPSALFVFTVEAAEAPADGSAGFRGADSEPVQDPAIRTATGS